MGLIFWSDFGNCMDFVFPQTLLTMPHPDWTNSTWGQIYGPSCAATIRAECPEDSWPCTLTDQDTYIPTKGSHHFLGTTVPSPPWELAVPAKDVLPQKWKLKLPVKMMVQFSAAITESIITSSITVLLCTLGPLPGTGTHCSTSHLLLRRWPAATLQLSKPIYLQDCVACRSDHSQPFSRTF